MLVARIEEKIKVFSLKMIQDFVTMLEHFEINDIELEDIKTYKTFKIEQAERNYQKDMQRSINRQKEWMLKGKKCPHCKIALILAEVNTLPGNQVGGGLKTQWFCPDQTGCGYVNYSTLSINQWMKRLKIKMFDNGKKQKIKNQRAKVTADCQKVKKRN